MTSTKKKPQWISSSFGDFAATQAIKPKSAPTKRKKNGHFVQEPDSNANSALLPWSEKHKPLKETDLSVHKAKIAEVKDWLLSHLCSQRDKNHGSILVLTGPAGAGKSATIDVLSKDLNIELQEWSNPATTTNEEYTMWKDFRILQTDSQRKQFQDFLLRANKYCSLSLSGQEPSNSAHGRKIIVVEDIPNALYRNVKDFHDILRQFQATSRNPLVFIISDSYVGESSLHRLFPKKAQLDLRINCINFNAVTNTNLVKCLTKIVNTESQLNNINVPSKDALDLLISSNAGDIRACINSLQFYCTNEYYSGKPHAGDSLKNSTAKKSTSKEKSSKAKKQIAESDGGSLLMGKDTSLFLFKALGKILYCKREAVPDSEKSKQLPRHLQVHTRDRLLISPEEITEKTHTDKETFNLYLHQNYLDFYQNIDAVANASDWFSIADYVTTQWSTRDLMKNYGSSLATRGVIFANHQKSTSSTGAVSRGWKPLNKPQWFHAFKEGNSNKRTAEDLFYDMRHPAVDLHTEVLPYLAKINVSLRTPSHISFVQMISRFNINSYRPSATLGQMENATTDIDDMGTEVDSKMVPKQDDENSVTLSQLGVETQGSCEESDSFEENLIEDFSDDDDLADFLLM
ncbi:cell cycle checkpoint protein RAD17-like isoform X2 [Rhopilema esculentum]|uniref:cell cycle checkpoint protein RAD17-like isoform X2 n=1 Tax=Rhopilema esculentum TaxID=499914 RepID=UPI0031D64480